MYKILILTLLAVFSNAQGAESVYFSFIDKNALFENDYATIESIQINEKTKKLTFDGMTIEMSECDLDFNCLFYKNIKIAIPVNCDSSVDNEWSYNKYKYKITNNIDPYHLTDYSKNLNTKLLITVYKGKKEIGNILYSSSKGIVAFDFLENNSKNSSNTFFLESGNGLFRRSCVFPYSRELDGSRGR